MPNYFKYRQEGSAKGLFAAAIVGAVWAAGTVCSPVWADSGQPAAMQATPPASAVERLEATVAREPANLGAHLDLAVALCQQGAVARAQRLFLWLDAQPDVPPGILEVISWYRRSPGCREGLGWEALWPRGFVALGAGRTHNLNLGPVADRVWVVGLGQELELGQGSRPLGAAARQAEAGATWDLGQASPRAKGWELGLYGQGLRYEGQPNFGLNAGNALLRWRAPEQGHTAAEFQLATARLTLGDGTRLAAQTVHASRLWATGEAGWVGTQATLTLLDYAQRAALDARQLDTRLRMRWDGATVRWTADAAWLEDREVRDRPGGNRHGPFVMLQAQWAHAMGTALEANLRWAHTRDSRPYAAELFGPVARNTRSLTAHMVWRQRLAPGWHLRTEARWSAARDTLPLFTYTARAVMVSVERGFEPR